MTIDDVTLAFLQTHPNRIARRIAVALKQFPRKPIADRELERPRIEADWAAFARGED